MSVADELLSTTNLFACVAKTKAQNAVSRPVDLSAQCLIMRIYFDEFADTGVYYRCARNFAACSFYYSQVNFSLLPVFPASAHNAITRRGAIFASGGGGTTIQFNSISSWTNACEST
jgi:hypothetical protein